MAALTAAAPSGLLNKVVVHLEPIASCPRSSLSCSRFAPSLSLTRSARPSQKRPERLVARAGAEPETVSADAGADSVVPEVASLPEEADTEGVAAPSNRKKPGPLAKGGTLRGQAAAGKAPAAATLGKAPAAATSGEAFSDSRWKDGTWDLTQFTANGVTDWDAVIDAEVQRRKWLEATPEGSTNEAPVLFDTSIIPWWAWVKRFHLPEAEKLNGRAAMVGYFAAYVVDSLTGAGLVDQQNSFLGKLLLIATVVGVLLIRQNSDVSNIKNLADEWTFYDKQWQATWKEGPPPTGSDRKTE